MEFLINPILLEEEINENACISSKDVKDKMCAIAVGGEQCVAIIDDLDNNI